MLLNNPRHEEEKKDIKINTDTDTMTPREKFTILGWTVNQIPDYHNHLNNVTNKIHHRIHRAMEVTKYMSENEKQRLLLQTHTYSAPSTMEPP